MINPSEVGKAGEMVRLKTLEAIWIQGKLRMWGRWSYIGGGSGGNMFNQLLASGKVTKTAINEALRRMKKSAAVPMIFGRMCSGRNMLLPWTVRRKVKCNTKASTPPGRKFTSEAITYIPAPRRT